jgi:hypothetical protein
MNTLSAPHCKENPIYVLPEKKLRGLSLKFLHSCICERFIYSQDWSNYNNFLQQNRQTDRGNIYNKSLTET